MDKHDHARTSWRRLGRESDMEEEFSLVCQMSDDGNGDDGAWLLYSGSYFDHLRPIRDALCHHVLQASCQDDSFGVITAMHVVCFTTGEIVLKITLILQLKSLLHFIGWCIILK